MADFLDDSNKLVGALGSTFVKKIDKMQAKQEATQQDVVEVKQTLPKYNLEVVQGIKKLAESQNKNIGTKEIVDLGKSMLKAVTGEINNITQAAFKEFLPIESELKNIISLLQSSDDENKDKGMEKLEAMKSVGLDIKSFSEELSSSIDRLSELYNKNKIDKENKKKELLTERDILRERGINTYLDEKNQKLEIKTFEQERIEKLQILAEEKRLKLEEKQLNREIKETKRSDFIHDTTQERLINKEKQLTEDQKKLQDRKEKAGMLSGRDNEQGPFAQTIGAAYNQFRLMGKEIFGFGKSIIGVGKSAFGFVGSIGSSFKGLSTSLSSFTKSTESSGKSLGLFGNIMKVTIIPILGFLGSIIMTFISAIMSGITSLMGMAGSLLGLGGGSMGGIGGAVKKGGGLLSKVPLKGGIAGIAGGMALDYAADKATESGHEKLGAGLSVGSDALTGASTGAMIGSVVPGVGTAIGGAIGGVAGAGYGLYKNWNKISPKDQNTNLNKLSVDNMSGKEAGDNNNVVLAPNNVVNNTNQSTVMGMPPINQDRSFINLNAPAIAI